MLKCRVNIIHSTEKVSGMTGFVHFYRKGGNEYAEWRVSVRNGGRVTHVRRNLGRVVDRDRLIFKKRGAPAYGIDADGTPREVTTDELPKLPEREPLEWGEERDPLDFGDVFLSVEYMRRMGLLKIMEGLLEGEGDTVCSLLVHKVVTTKSASMHTAVWWKGSYACYLFPEADLRSQAISACLEGLGREHVQQRFFKAYLGMLYGDREGPVGTLVDSTGLPSSSRMQMVQISSHNGEVSSQARLIYVVDRKNSMPIYMRPIQGNIVDVTTVRTTFAMLAQYGVEVDWAILDAGYYSSKNAADLMEAGIKFMVRVKLDLKIVTDVIGKDLAKLKDIECAKNAVVYGNRIVYMVRHEVKVAGRTAWLYVGVDPTARDNARQRETLKGLDAGKPFDEIDKKVRKMGAFAILANVKMRRAESLPLYYTRQKVEQVFDLAKNYADLLPLRVANELTLNGHLLLTFAATAMLQSLQQDLIAKRTKKSKININGALTALRNHKCKVFDHALVPYEPAAENSAIYRAFKIEVPKTIPWELPDPRLKAKADVMLDEDPDELDLALTL